MLVRVLGRIFVLYTCKKLMNTSHVQAIIIFVCNKHKIKEEKNKQE